MQRQKSKKWTVVGFYEDNMQPYVEHVSATAPDEAVSKLTESVRVVEVFEGSHKGRLGNNEVL
jgi:hypothetical protein